MYRYNEDIVPPAPFWEIQISHTTLALSANLSALLDTGSDKSFIPLSMANELELLFLGMGVVEGINGDGEYRPIFDALISMDRSTWDALEIMGWHENFAILGRDVLNRYHITLDGPNLALTITP